MTREFASAVVDRAQRMAQAAFGAWGARFLLESRWPLFTYLARLEPPFPALPDYNREGVAAPPPLAVVSWSSREAELGGLNWAARFADEVFGGLPGVSLREDVECADIYVFRSKLPINFGGVLLFVDGERSPDDAGYQELLAGYPASMVIGPMSPGGLAVHFPVPYASTSFASRLESAPAALALPYRARAANEAAAGVGERRFAAYLAYRCWEHRERFYYELDRQARASGVGSVDALSRCGNNSVSEDQRRPARYSKTYLDDAAELFSGYRFAMVFENRLSPRYVTEKIVNAFLGGAVPIYWGSPYVLRLFNPRAFIHVNAFTDFEAAARYVVQVAQDPQAYEAYLSEAPLRNTSDARWHFSWHRQSLSPSDTATLRDGLASIALEKHRAGLGGQLQAVERRLWDYMPLFQGLN